MSDLTDELIEQVAYRLAGHFRGDEGQWRGCTEAAEVAVKAVMAAFDKTGRVVLDLPEPDGQDEQGDPAWTVRGVVADEPEHIVAYAHNGSPRVSSIGPPEDPDLVEVYAVGLIAAARAARRLAAEGGGQT